MSKHRDAPPQSVFDKIDVLSIPNLSLRMHGVTAACITPQIDTLDARIKRYNERYARVEKAIRAMDGVRSVPVQLPQVGIVGDSIQVRQRGGATGERDAPRLTLSLSPVRCPRWRQRAPECGGGRPLP
jgi:hypothetical protein